MIGAAHGRPVAGGEDAAAVWRPAQPEPQAGLEGRHTDPCRQAQQPAAELCRQDTLEHLGVVARTQQRLRHKAGVLGVIADHPAAEEEPMGERRVAEETKGAGAG